MTNEKERKQPMLHAQVRRFGAIIAFLLLVSLFAAGCQVYGPSGALAGALNGERGSDGATAALSTTSGAAEAAQEPAAQEPPTQEPPAQEPAAQEQEAERAPVLLSIPAIGLEAQVTPMGWELVMQGEEITTRWSVPLDTLGWAVNSAEPGAAGNVVIVGHQALGSALFRRLALGEIAVGQEISLQTADGSIYLYRVSEVSDPIPAIGATAEEGAQGAAYLAPSSTARLTLVSGWPADTTTHRVFVVAEYSGEAS